MGMRTLMFGSSLTLACMLASQSVGAQTEPQSRYFKTSDGVELHYLEAGSGRTIVFVPGFAFPAEVWEPQLTRFVRTHRVVALDPRSQGRSGKPTEGLQLDRDEFTRAWVRGMYRSEQTDEYKELIALEDAWALAVQEGDVEGLDGILGDDYIGTTAAGGTQTKAEYLADFLSGARKTYSLTTDDLRVRVYGDTAVLTHGGHAEGEHTGRSTSGDYRWTHVLVKRGGRWEAVANHVTRIQEE